MVKAILKVRGPGRVSLRVTRPGDFGEVEDMVAEEAEKDADLVLGDRHMDQRWLRSISVVVVLVVVQVAEPFT